MSDLLKRLNAISDSFDLVTKMLIQESKENEEKALVISTLREALELCRDGECTAYSARNALQKADEIMGKK